MPYEYREPTADGKVELDQARIKEAMDRIVFGQEILITRMKKDSSADILYQSCFSFNQLQITFELLASRIGA